MDLQTLAVQGLVIAMMVAVGLELRPVDLLDAVRRRGALAVLLVINVVLVPLAAWLLVDAQLVGSGLAVGLLLCAVAPAGPTGPLFTSISRGDVGFGVAVMVVLGLVALITAPLSLELMIGQGGGEPLFFPMVRTLVVFQVAPLVAAMALRRVRPQLAKKLAPPASRIANGLLLAVIVGLLVTKGDVLLTSGLAVHAVAVGYAVVTTVPAFWPGDTTGRVRAGGFVTAVRNMSVALLLSAEYFAGSDAEVGILLLGFWTMLIPAAIAFVVGRRSDYAATGTSIDRRTSSA